MLTTHDHSFWSPAGLAFHTALSMWPFLPLTCTLFWTWISLTALPCRPVPLICLAFYTTLWQQCPLPLIAYFLTGVLNRFPGFLYPPLASGRIFSSEENMLLLYRLPGFAWGLWDREVTRWKMNRTLILIFNIYNWCKLQHDQPMIIWAKDIWLTPFFINVAFSFCFIQS